MLKIDKDTKIKNGDIRNFDYDKEYFPKIGMLGTEYVGSDRYAVVCTQVYSLRKVAVGKLHYLTEDNVKNNPDILIDEEGVMWMSPDVLKKYGIDGSSDIERWTLRINKTTGKKSWHEEGKARKSSSIHWGIANPYRDPDF